MFTKTHPDNYREQKTKLAIPPTCRQTGKVNK